MFGYRVGTIIDGSFPAGADSGPAVQGYGDLIKGFGKIGLVWHIHMLLIITGLEGHATFGRVEYLRMTPGQVSFSRKWYDLLLARVNL